MNISLVFPLEKLPVIVLERICEYLRCLIIEWKGNGVVLASIASRSDLKSLETLKLLPSNDLQLNEIEQLQNALHLFLLSLNPFQRLELDGYISPKTFDITVHRHGESLCTL